MRSALVLAGFFAVGCVGASPEAPVPVRRSEAPAAVSPVEAPAAVEEAAYAYSPAGKRDPFFTPRAQPTPVDEVQCGVLCRWDLEQYRLVSTVTAQASPRGMVEAPNGTGYVVAPGDLIGKRGGRVAAIRAGQVFVDEPCQDANGGVRRCRTVLGMAADAQEQPENLIRPNG